MCTTFKTLSVLQNYCYVTCWLHGPFNERRLFDAIFLETRPAEIYKQRKKLPWLENRWQFLVKSLSYTFPIRVNENQTPFTTNLFTLSSSSLNAKVALKVCRRTLEPRSSLLFKQDQSGKKSSRWRKRRWLRFLLWKIGKGSCVYLRQKVHDIS